MVGSEAVQSKTIPLPGDLRWRRLIVVAMFLGLLYYFRGLAPVFICFVVFERSLGWLADQLDARTPLHRTGAIASVLTVLVALVGLGVFAGVRELMPVVDELRDNGERYIHAMFDHPSVEKARAMLGLEGENLTQVVKDHAGTAVSYATGTAHIILFMLIGLLLAIIYLFERDQIHVWYDTIVPGSVPGTLARWFGYVGDAIAITVRMQVVVAAVNAVITLPVLIVLGLPHIPTLFLLILVTGLVPVVGNVISGAVLCYVAYTVDGWWAVGVFLVTTFVLHKIESYYISPRLAAQHVKLPGLVLVVSLLLFEQTLGFVGLFLSFPALYVASKITAEWRDEVEQLVHEVAPELAADLTPRSAASVPGLGEGLLAVAGVGGSAGKPDEASRAIAEDPEPEPDSEPEPEPDPEPDHESSGEASAQPGEPSPERRASDDDGTDQSSA